MAPCLLAGCPRPLTTTAWWPLYRTLLLPQVPQNCSPVKAWLTWVVSQFELLLRANTNSPTYDSEQFVDRHV